MRLPLISLRPRSLWITPRVLKSLLRDAPAPQWPLTLADVPDANLPLPEEPRDSEASNPGPPEAELVSRHGTALRNPDSEKLQAITPDG